MGTPENPALSKGFGNPVVSTGFENPKVSLGFAYEVTADGSSLGLAERRTLTFGDRKIVLGSTPLFAETSAICRAYAASDQRVFELPCAACGTFQEIAWKDIEWPPGEPERAAFRCPSCGELVGKSTRPAWSSAGNGG